MVVKLCNTCTVFIFVDDMFLKGVNWDISKDSGGVLNVE